MVNYLFLIKIVFPFILSKLIDVKNDKLIVKKKKKYLFCKVLK